MTKISLPIGEIIRKRMTDKPNNNEAFIMYRDYAVIQDFIRPILKWVTDEEERKEGL